LDSGTSVGIAAATLWMAVEVCGFVGRNTLQSEQLPPHFQTDLHATCLLVGNKYLCTPVNQIQWRSNPRKQNHQQRECRFVVISFSTVCLCLYPIFLYHL